MLSYTCISARKFHLLYVVYRAYYKLIKTNQPLCTKFTELYYTDTIPTRFNGHAIIFKGHEVLQVPKHQEV
jgi:hypothetical protein